MRAKLSDVAKKAGVSPTTVSRVINNYGYISEKTRKKVHDAMDELNYQPNSLARSLHGKKTKLIGLIFPGVSNPFFGELVEKIENRLFDAGYKVILCNAAYNVEKERSYLKMLLANQVDGIIAGAHNLGIKEYQDAELPIVSFDRKQSDNVPIVSSDNYHGGVLATQALFDAGCRKIYFIGNPDKNGNPTDERLLGYQDTVKKLQLEPHIHPVSFSETPMLKEITIKQLLLEHDVDGIVCSDDLTALLVMQVAKSINLKIPDDLKITGFDGTKFIQEYHPELSTVVQPIDDIAILLVKLLEQRINHPEEPFNPEPYILPVKFLRSKTIE